MKLYLSSFKIGNEGQKLTEMVGGKKLIAVISNALDCYSDVERRKKDENTEIEELKLLGLNPEVLDLRDYFGKSNESKTHLNNFDAVWVRGGNCFVLKVAMHKSGFDLIIQNKLQDENFVYAGYSAGGCVLTQNMEVYSMTDDLKRSRKCIP